VSPALRETLLRFARGGKVQRAGSKKIQPLNSPEYDQLLLSLNASCLTALAALISSISKSSTGLPSAYSHFLEALASPSPLSSMVQVNPQTEHIISSLCEKQETVTPHIILLLHQELPLVYEVVISLAEPTLKSEMRELLRDMWSKVCHLNKKYPSHPEIASLEKTDTALACFPRLPLMRERGQYISDRKREAKKSGCTKKYPGHPSLLPGIMAMFCPHGRFILDDTVGFI
jgi:hypothetical protein